MANKLRNDCFALPPGVDWVPVDEALERLTSRLSCVAESEVLPVENTVGRVVAKTARAQRPHPAHRNAAVDGFAVCFGTSSNESFALVDGVAAAGRPTDVVLSQGQAVKILTGAMVPDGTDAVVLQEESEILNDRVLLEGAPKLGANIRPVGEDTGLGEDTVVAGERLNPMAVAHAISVGIRDIECFTPLRVGVLSTGDEITNPGAEAQPYQVYDANRPMLISQLQSWGYEAIDLGHVQDDATAVEHSLRDAVDRCDAILTSGGASASSEDHISATLERLADLHTWRIAVKPGRPLALAQWDGVPIFGLPGNPIAAFVCTLIFARPALQILQGRTPAAPVAYRLPAHFEKNKKQGRTEFLRARVNQKGKAEIFKSEGSGRVSGLHWADGLVALGHDAMEIKNGSPVTYIPFSSFD